MDITLEELAERVRRLELHCLGSDYTRVTDEEIKKQRDEHAIKQEELRKDALANEARMRAEEQQLQAELLRQQSIH